MFFARQRVDVDTDARFGVEWAVTDRFAGSAQADEAFTLGGKDRALAGAIAGNRAVLTDELALTPGSLRFMKQVHGSAVVSVRGPSHDGLADPTCDAMVTDDPSIALAALVADCTPVLLWDATAGWVGAVHAGRAGMMTGVVGECVDHLRGRGANHLQALVGPSICGRCYEVPASMREQACEGQQAAYAVSWTGTPAIDVGAAVVAQLHARDVPVHWLPGCTRESPDLFSHRADAGSGRFAAVVRLHPRDTSSL